MNRRRAITTAMSRFFHLLMEEVMDFGNKAALGLLIFALLAFGLNGAREKLNWTNGAMIAAALLLCLVWKML